MTTMAVMAPVLNAVERCGDPNAKSVKDSGFNPLFRCPIYSPSKAKTSDD